MRQEARRFDLAEPVPGPTTERLGREAARLGIVVVTTVFERRQGGLYHNPAVALDRDGTLAGRYRKRPIPEEAGYHATHYFSPGDDGFRPIETSLGRLGVLICWDQWFPEAARLMALAGAELLLYPSAIGWDPSESEAERRRQTDAWLTVQRGHAIANGLPVATGNRTGLQREQTNGGGTRFWGAGFIAGAQGEILAQAPADGVPFHPYYTVKDIWGMAVFLALFFAVVFFMPEMGGYFLEQPNFEPANPLKTPEHIAPVWYFTPYYAILRAVPSFAGTQVWGVLAMFAALVVFFFLPWLDRSPVPSMRYQAWLSRLAIGVFAISFLVLGYLGTRPPTPQLTVLAQIFTVLYFAYFLLMLGIAGSRKPNRCRSA